MWPTSQQPMAWTLTHRIIMILHFLNFWSYISFWFSSYNVLVTIFGNVHRPCRHYSIIVNNGVYSVFPYFLAIFTSVTILGNVHRPCNQCIKIIKRFYIMSILFFLIFPDHFNIFAWITILGNAHRWCKQYTNIVEDGLCNAAPFFSDVLGIFASITILGNMHRPCKQYLNLVNNSLFFFSWVFLTFFLSFY